MNGTKNIVELWGGVNHVVLINRIRRVDQVGQMENAGELYSKSKNVGFKRFQERADVHYEKLAGLVWTLTGLASRCQDFSRERLALS